MKTSYYYYIAGAVILVLAYWYYKKTKVATAVPATPSKSDLKKQEKVNVS
jgi:hypothetical protein